MFSGVKAFLVRVDGRCVAAAQGSSETAAGNKKSQRRQKCFHVFFPECVRSALIGLDLFTERDNKAVCGWKIMSPTSIPVSPRCGYISSNSFGFSCRKRADPFLGQITTRIAIGRAHARTGSCFQARSFRAACSRYTCREQVETTRTCSKGQRLSRQGQYFLQTDGLCM